MQADYDLRHIPVEKKQPSEGILTTLLFRKDSVIGQSFRLLMSF